MNETKAILLCGSRIAIPVMRDLFFHQQLAVVVIPQHCTDFTEQVRLLLKDTGTEIITVSKTGYVDSLLNAMKKYNPTVGLMFTFSYKLPAAIYNMPAKGFYNLHPGPLPAYRGPDPIFQQIKNKEPFAALTIHKVDDNFDSGEIVLSDKIRLSVDDTYGILTSKLAELAARMIETLMKMAGFDMAIPSRRQDNANAGYYKRQSAGDISIDWETMDAASIVALIHACNPWNKGAVTSLNNNIIRLLDAHKIALNTTAGSLPGTIISISETGLTVTTKEKEAICIKMIYNDEGFLMANRLKDSGIHIGNRFHSI